MKANKGFYDSFGGLIPCTPVSWYSDIGTRARMVDLRINKTVGAYKRGEIVSTFALHLVKKAGSNRIRTIEPFSNN